MYNNENEFVNGQKVKLILIIIGIVMIIIHSLVNCNNPKPVHTYQLPAVKGRGDTIAPVKLDTLSHFDTAAWRRYAVKMASMDYKSQRIALLAGHQEMAYKDSTTKVWHILDTSVALEIALDILEMNMEQNSIQQRRINSHQTFMRWLAKQPCDPFLFNQFYKSYEPDTEFWEVPRHLKL